MTVLWITLAALALISTVAIYRGYILQRQLKALPETPIDHGLTLYFRDGFLINASPEVLNIFEDLQIPRSDRGLHWILDALNCPSHNRTASLDAEDEHDLKFTCENGLSATFKVQNKRAALNLSVKSGDSATLLHLALARHLARVFRQSTDAIPNAISIYNASGQRIFENEMYRVLLDDDTFEASLHADAPMAPHHEERIEQQISYTDGSAEKHFDLLRHYDGTYVFEHIQDSSARFQADQSARTFRRTMSQTFADLSVGLAIFDTEQHLIAFNPALVDLLDLPVPFLIQNPSLFSLFAHLRENRTMPEPVSFADWQDNLLKLVRGAEEGDFNETWHRLDGKALRVMGRPQPEGGFAFLVEDVTNEITLNKSVSDQLDLYQHALNGIKSAVAVFDSSNTLIASNTAFDEIFQVPNAQTIHAFNLRDLCSAITPEISEDFIVRLLDGKQTELVTTKANPGDILRLNPQRLGNGNLMLTLMNVTPKSSSTVNRYHRSFSTTT